MRLPAPGDVISIGRDASPQFALNQFRFRVIGTRDWDHYSGWIWLDGYQLDRAGNAIERRAIFVLLAGLEWVQPARGVNH